METEKEPKFSFLLSTRFWMMIIGALAVYLQMKGLIGDAEMWLVGTISAGFVGIKTIDRNTGDAKVEAATIVS